MGYQETGQRPQIEQRVFDFSVVDGHAYSYWIGPPIEKARKAGFVIVSASKIESPLSGKPAEETLSKEEILKRTLRITFGVLAHRFYTLSAVATLCAENPDKPNWNEKKLEMVLRTWGGKEIRKAQETLEKIGRWKNEYDYQALWDQLTNEVFKEKPFTDTIPLPWIFPASGDKLPTPAEIFQYWQSEGLPKIGLKFAQACLSLQKSPYGVEFLSWNRRATLFEASVLAFVNIPNGKETLKLIVPLRLDELWLQPRKIGNGNFWQPKVIDLKTSLPLNVGSKIEGERSQIAPFFYLLVAEKIFFNSPWTPRQPKRIFLGPDSFNSTIASNLDAVGRGKEGDHLPPILIFRKFNGENGTISDQVLTPPTNWREELLSQLLKVQEILRST